MQCALWKDTGTIIVWEWVSDVVSKPSAARGKPETSVETSKVEKKRLLSPIEALHDTILELYREHLGIFGYMQSH